MIKILLTILGGSHSFHSVGRTFRVQICPQFSAFCKFFSKKSSNLLPSVLKEGFDIGFCDGLTEAFHEDLEVLEGDVLSTEMIESLMDLLGGEDIRCFHYDLLFNGTFSEDGPVLILCFSRCSIDVEYYST